MGAGGAGSVPGPNAAFAGQASSLLQAWPTPLLLVGAEATPALGESGSKHSCTASLTAPPACSTRNHKRRRTAPSSLTPVVYY